jgi:hypothetical protein
MNCSRVIVIVMGLLFILSDALAAAELFVYPSKGQTKEQQEQDEFSCYKWAKEQTGFDPNQPMQQAAPPPPQGGAVKGAGERRRNRRNRGCHRRRCRKGSGHWSGSCRCRRCDAPPSCSGAAGCGPGKSKVGV